MYHELASQGAWSNEAKYWDKDSGKYIEGYARKWHDVFVFSVVCFVCNSDAVAFGHAWESNIACRLHLMGAECECTQETSRWGATHPAASTTNAVIRVT